MPDDWFERNNLRTPEDGQRVLVVVRCQNPAGDFVTVDRYDAARDLFHSDDYTHKVVLWMPILEATTVPVRWENWREEFEARNTSF